MKKCAFIPAIGIFINMWGIAWGSNVATQTVTFSIEPISEISVSGDPPSLIATSATAGGNPADVTDTSTSYAVTTNGSSEKVVVNINSPMPDGTMLCIMATAPAGATSVGNVDLDTTDQNLVTGITQVAQANLQITYIFESTASAGVIASTSRVVTFTLSP